MTGWGLGWRVDWVDGAGVLVGLRVGGVLTIGWRVVWVAGGWVDSSCPCRLTGRLEGLEIRNERTRSMLHFANVSAWHYGNYTCLASNKLGTSSISLRLIRTSLCPCPTPWAGRTQASGLPTPTALTLQPPPTP